MKIKKHIVSLLQTNCYVVWDEETGSALVIDPGGNPRKLVRTIKEKNLELEAIIHTHSHWDHTAGSNALQRLTGAPVLRHPLDHKSGLLHRPRKADNVKVRDLEDGQTIKFGSMSFKVIHTPGHSRGGICLYSEGQQIKEGPANVLFGGDLIFEGSVGRTDLSGGNFKELLRSLIIRLASLPDDVVVYPGHGPATTLGAERRANPFFLEAQKFKAQLEAKDG